MNFPNFLLSSIVRARDFFQIRHFVSFSGWNWEIRETEVFFVYFFLLLFFFIYILETLVCLLKRRKYKCFCWLFWPLFVLVKLFGFFILFHRGGLPVCDICNFRPKIVLLEFPDCWGWSSCWILTSVLHMTKEGYDCYKVVPASVSSEGKHPETLWGCNYM